MPLILDSPSPSTASSDHGLPPDTPAAWRHLHHEADVLVVGAGIFGTAIAIALARQNRSVILLEKSLKEPDRIVGELLQPGGVEALEQLGLRSCLEGIDAVVVKGYKVIYYEQEVEIPYPENATPKGKRPEGRSFHHGRFIRKLRERAMMEENIMVVETTVTGTVKNGWTGQVLGVESVTKEEKDYYFGKLTIIADGYASKFRKEYIRHQPVSKSKFWGLELVDADLPLPLHGHVVLGEGAPILLYQIGMHETRCLVDVPEGTQSASVANGGVKGHLKEVVLPSLPKSVQSSFEVALEKGKLKSMPNSFLPPSTNKIPGMVMLGDAMNMRHPLTGGGMTVAFNDVVLLRDLLGPENVPDLGDTKMVIKQMSTFHWKRKNLTSVINILAQALYSLFAANGRFRVCFNGLRIAGANGVPPLDPQLKALQLGCFRYFQRGGQCVDGPAGLLAGIIRQPFVLFYHFFAVALLSIWLVVSESPLYKIPFSLFSSISIFWKACLVLFPFISSELRS
ncbi:Squalene epoxidase [Hypocenomyce scalaris]|nr:Squalene epoxidase [Hypocenomyce scalaris]